MGQPRPTNRGRAVAGDDDYGDGRRASDDDGAVGGNLAAPEPTLAPSTVLEKASHAAWCKSHMSKCESQGEKENQDDA